MIKNGPKVLLTAICLCIVLCGIYFTQKTFQNDIPHQRIEIPFTVDLNQAEPRELELIPGIEPALAEAIVAYRVSYGNYVDTIELLDVHGMSEELYNDIKHYVSLGGS